MARAEIELSGHIVDSLILPRVWGAIEDAGAHFHVLDMRIGEREMDTSYARMEVSADTPAAARRPLAASYSSLARSSSTGATRRRLRITRNGVLPDNFYSTTNLPTQVRVGGSWLSVENIEMDVAIVVEREAGRRVRQADARRAGRG